MWQRASEFHLCCNAGDSMYELTKVAVAATCSSGLNVVCSPLSVLRLTTRGGQCSHIRHQEGRISRQLHHPLPVWPGLHPAPSSCCPLQSRRTVGAAPSSVHGWWVMCLIELDSFALNFMGCNRRWANVWLVGNNGKKKYYMGHVENFL